MAGELLGLIVEDLRVKVEAYERLRFEYGYTRGRLKVSEICLKATRKYLAERGIDERALMAEGRGDATDG